jgi:hypothetical protein
LLAEENYFILQSMNAAYWISALAGAAFLGFAHSHTDELPIVFGFVMIVGALLGAIAPRRFLLSWAITGAPIPIVETLVHYSLISAPYPVTEAKPWLALIAYVPAAVGVAVGAGVRRMTSRAPVT